MSAFFDTNILVYSVSSDRRAARAIECVSAGGMISVQILNEFANVMHKKAKMAWGDIIRILDDIYIQFPDPKPLTKLTHSNALALAKVHNVAFYDALVVASAIEANCTELFTEDLQHGRNFDGLTIINPFYIRQIN